jgi:hypothetical protein
MTIQCENCNATFESEQAVNEIELSRGAPGSGPGGETKQVCPHCEDPQSTFSEL